jgi:3-deoxy-D-manno-octulosonate 8-phosphate phosphatase KdsC-like HAD superfamily phosphatase
VLLLLLLLPLLHQVLLSVAVTTVQAFLLNAVGYVVLSMVLAASVCLAVGLLVAPSLATDEVRQRAVQITLVAYHGC